MKRTGKVTLADIARSAKTNASTVSRVLNNDKKFSVSAECRKRILAIADELQYCPKNSAKSLATGKSYCIGVILGSPVIDLSSPSVSLLLNGMIQELNSHGYNAVLLLVGHSNSIDEEVNNKIRSGGVDGFFVGSNMLGSRALKELEANNIPVVTIDRINKENIEKSSISFVLEDIASAYDEMAAELYESGHRRCACLTNAGTGFRLQQRATLIEKTFNRAGVAVMPDDIFAFTPARTHIINDRHEAHVAAGNLMDRLRRYSCIVATSDMAAFGLMDALRQHGLEPGRDIAVAGYDNLESGQFYQTDAPFLSTIDPRKADKGTKIAQLLLSKIDSGDTTSETCFIRARFILRESFCPARSGSL